MTHYGFTIVAVRVFVQVCRYFWLTAEDVLCAAPQQLTALFSQKTERQENAFEKRASVVRRKLKNQHAKVPATSQSTAGRGEGKDRDTDHSRVRGQAA